MSRKIGLIGGLGWPATVAYYKAICRAPRAVSSAGSPEMTIESLDMAKTVAARGAPGDTASWTSYDAMFRQALDRLDLSGCDLAAIASVTPHARLAEISRQSPLPIVNLVDAVAQRLPRTGSKNAVVLGTRVTMEGALFDQALGRLGMTLRRADRGQVDEFSDLLDRYFYTGRAAEGRDALIRYVQSVFGTDPDTVCILACTDLAPAFPDNTGEVCFVAEGIRMFDATAAHVEAILSAAADPSG